MVEHYSRNIQNAILGELFKAKSSIQIAVAWFTNDLLFQPLLLKLQTGVKVEIILNKDEINDSDENEIDFDQFVRQGGVLRWNTSKQLLHDKFCIIDNSIVISGSYNWTNKAEYNRESISIFKDDQNTVDFFADEYKSLCEHTELHVVEEPEVDTVDEQEEDEQEEEDFGLDVLNAYDYTIDCLEEIRNENLGHSYSDSLIFDLIVQKVKEIANIAQDDESIISELISAVTTYCKKYQFSKQFKYFNLSEEGWESLLKNGYFCSINLLSHPPLLSRDRGNAKYSMYDLCGEYGEYPKKYGFQYVNVIGRIKIETKYQIECRAEALNLDSDKEEWEPVIKCKADDGTQAIVPLSWFRDLCKTKTILDNFEEIHLVSDVKKDEDGINYNDYTFSFNADVHTHIFNFDSQLQNPMNCHAATNGSYFIINLLKGWPIINIDPFTINRNELDVAWTKYDDKEGIKLSITRKAILHLVVSDQEFSDDWLFAGIITKYIKHIEKKGVKLLEYYDPSKVFDDDFPNWMKYPPSTSKKTYSFYRLVTDLEEKDGHVKQLPLNSDDVSNYV